VGEWRQEKQAKKTPYKKRKIGEAVGNKST
jgi:hypothetical protein